VTRFGARSRSSALAGHRRTHGLAPGIRIGLHLAYANERSGDHSGMGVQVAARIGSLADARQVLASAGTLAGERPFPVSDPRAVSPKAVSGEVGVVTVLWS
jgi:class 3 adenylate cyclase